MSVSLLNYLLGFNPLNAPGTNACYTERLENVAKFEGDKAKYEYVVINMEWGGFGSVEGTDKSLLDPWLTHYDRNMDKKPDVTNPGKQM